MSAKIPGCDEKSEMDFCVAIGIYKRFVHYGLVAMVCGASLAQICFAQESPNATPAPHAAALAGDPDNSHVATTRYSVAAHQGLALPKLQKESLVVCLKGESLKRTPGNGTAEIFGAGPGSTIWNRGGVGYWFENPSDLPVEMVVIELKDSYAFDQLYVPWSERDPVYLDPAHFRIAFENVHVRVLRLHLPAREGTEEAQFPQRMEITLRDATVSVATPPGKTEEEIHLAGSVIWEKERLQSIVNAGSDPVDSIIVELKHPFCYVAPESSITVPKDFDPRMRPYLVVAREAFAKKAAKIMQKAVGDEKKGLVRILFKVDRDGVLSEDSFVFHTVLANQRQVEAALSILRVANPFPPLPDWYDKPELKLGFEFFFNLPRTPHGCP